MNHVNQQTAHRGRRCALEALGFKYTSDRGWLPPINSRREAIGGTPPDFSAEGDAVHALLMIRADALMDAPEASGVATEFQLIADAVEAYENKALAARQDIGREGLKLLVMMLYNGDTHHHQASIPTEMAAKPRATPSTAVLNPDRARVGMVTPPWRPKNV